MMDATQNVKHNPGKLVNFVLREMQGMNPPTTENLRIVDTIRGPFQRFFQAEAAGSILLLIATIAALVIANTPLQSIYDRILGAYFTLGTDRFGISKPILLWINDGLMAVFFFVIGLEIKRELFVGELSTLRKAMLPIFGAIGGIVFPILAFFVFNGGNEGGEGWAIPMATDIAFTIGILKLLGKRVPYGLIIFLAAFAIVDDLASVVVIAIFYSGDIGWEYVILSLFIAAILFFYGNRGYYNHSFFLLVGIVIWFLFLKSGIHPTIAGVLMAFTIPLRRRMKLPEFEKEMESATAIFKDGRGRKTRILLSTRQLGALDRMDNLTSLVQPPLQYLENRLHGWVIYVIMPIFAIANAGVSLDPTALGDLRLAYVIGGSLLVGKAFGISFLSWLALRFKLAELPLETNFQHIVGASILGGLGFTMSLFITTLAYTEAEHIALAKAGILAGSLIAGLLGYFVLRNARKRDCTEDEIMED